MKPAAVWHPCDDGLEPIRLAVLPVNWLPVLDGPDRLFLSAGTGMPSKTINQTLSEPGYDGQAGGPRIEILRRWLQFHGMEPIAEEITDRADQLLSRLRKWEIGAHAWNWAPDRHHDTALTAMAVMHLQDADEELAAIQNSAMGFADYLAQASAMLRARIARHAAEEKPAEPAEVPAGKRRRRGGQRRRDAKADRKIREAWQSGQYNTHYDLASALNTTAAEVKKALDADRKRQTRRKKAAE